MTTDEYKRRIATLLMIEPAPQTLEELDQIIMSRLRSGRNEANELACAMGHVIIESGFLPGISAPCRCDECRLVAARLDEAGYMEGVDDRWWDSSE